MLCDGGKPSVLQVSADFLPADGIRRIYPASGSNSSTELLWQPHTASMASSHCDVVSVIFGWKENEICVRGWKENYYFIMSRSRSSRLPLLFDDGSQTDIYSDGTTFSTEMG